MSALDQGFAELLRVPQLTRREKKAGHLTPYTAVYSATASYSMEFPPLNAGSSAAKKPKKSSSAKHALSQTSSLAPTPSHVGKDFQQDSDAVKKLPQRPLTSGSNKIVTEQAEIQAAFAKFQRDVKNLGFHASPFVPRNLKAYITIKQEMTEARAKRLNFLIDNKIKAAKLPKASACMASKVFGTDHSSVLSMPTVWRPQEWQDSQQMASWPSRSELKYEGNDRSSGGYERFFPMPRSGYFDERLLILDRRERIGQEFLWDGFGVCPWQQQTFAACRSTLDAIWGMRWMTEEEIYDRPQEVETGMEILLIGEEFLKEIRE